MRFADSGMIDKKCRRPQLLSMGLTLMLVSLPLSAIGQGFQGTNRSKATLEDVCWAGNIANAQSGQGDGTGRPGYAELIGRGALAYGSMTRTQYNNYKRYIRNNCPEAW